METQDIFQVTAVESISVGMKATLMESVTSDADVLFYWTILAAQWEEEDEQALLPMVTELFGSVSVDSRLLR